MISPFGPILANCLIPPPKREPIPAAIIINVVFILSKNLLVNQYIHYTKMNTLSQVNYSLPTKHTPKAFGPICTPIVEPIRTRSTSQSSFDSNFSTFSKPYEYNV